MTERGKRKAARTRDAKKDAKKSAQKASRKKTSGKTKRAPQPDFPVVGVGASAGGLDAFRKFLQGVSADSGVAYVLVQHLDPNHESMMAELLNRHTAVPVLEAEDGMRIEPNHVYMIPPNKFIRIADHGLFLDEPTHRRGLRMPIDYFFRSLAEARREAAICVILSGTGTDGTQGLREVKAAGGMAMVQNPDTADYDGMPRSALSTGLVDFVLPIEEMQEALANYLKHPYLRARSAGQSISQAKPDTFRAIVNLLRAHTDFDFRCYKPGTLDRRIHRRMGLRHIRDAAEYLKLIRKDRDELQLLFKDLLIGVTRFFRDPEVWDVLRDEVMTPLVESKRYEEPIRVWVVGCATGEEAYSIAILVFEELEKQQKNLPVQIYATDLDADAVETARAGWYPGSIVADISPHRLSRFFIEEGDGYRVGKRLRESVVFATQNVISDPPFSRLDLVSCRNLLIYLEPSVQTRLMELFHFALQEGGVLFLGTSESTNQSADLFSPVSKIWRIYRRTGSMRPGRGGFPIVPAAAEGRTSHKTPSRLIADKGDGARAEIAKRILLEQFAPASILVNRRFEVQYYYGPVRDYLDYPTGEPEVELPNLALDGLKIKLRDALIRALHKNNTAEDVARSVKRNGGTVAVHVKVQPVTHPSDDGPLLLVSFRDEPLAVSPDTDRTSREEERTPEEKSALHQLEFELQATREDLQSTIEELETANEELKASNEEVMSMNEELQSSNEELKTSREELQSLNEELTTVNNQLQEKVQELEDTNNDLTNLLVSTDIATLFLDTSLKIRRFTPAASELLHLIDGDIGRPIDDLAPRLEDPKLLRDTRKVLRQLQPAEAEVAHESGQSFLRRILPYRTSDNKIDGVVVTFADVTALREAADQLKRREGQQAAIAALGRIALTGDGIQELLGAVAERVAEQLNCPLVKLLELTSGGRTFLLRAGIGWKRGLVGKELVSTNMDTQAGYALTQHGPVIVENLAEEKRFNAPKLLLDHKVSSGITVIVGPVDRPWGVLGAHSRQPRRFTIDDVNFLQSVANLLHEAIQRERIGTRFQLALDAADLATWDWNPRSDSATWDDQLYQLLGIDPETPPCGAEFFKRVHPDDVTEFKQTIDAAIRDRTTFEYEFRIVRDGAVRWLIATGMVIDAGPNDAIRIIGINRDITEAKLAQERVAESEERYRLAMEAIADIVYDWDLETDRIVRSEGMYRMIGVPPSEASPARQWWIDRVHPEDRERMLKELSEAMDSGAEHYEHQYRVCHEDGSWVHVQDSGMILRDDSKKPYRIVGSRRNITERVTLDNKLRDAQERRRLALAATQTGTWEWRAGEDEMIWDARQAEIFDLEPCERISLSAIRSRIEPEDAAMRDKRLAATMEKGGTYECEFQLMPHDGETRWVTERGSSLGDGEERRLIGISFDVSHIKEAQARDALLMAELDHRVKNILANIQAVARQSMKGKTNIKEFIDALDGRLHALSNTHTLLSSMKWNGVEFHALLDGIFAPFASPGAGRLAIRGPRLMLSPGAAQSLALTMHELATNAAKHGALSADNGDVRVSWKEAKKDGAPVVVLDWKESDGPEVRKPNQKNFGLRVIENLAASELDAEVDLDFSPRGFTCRFVIPRGRLIATARRLTEQETKEEDSVTFVSTATGERGESRKLRLLLVEDSWTVSSQLKAQLEGLGHEVVGPAATVDQAMALAEMEGIDAAFLDIQLGDRTVFPVAERLSERGVPFAFVTGYTDVKVIPKEFRITPTLAKPLDDQSIVSALRHLSEVSRR